MLYHAAFCSKLNVAQLLIERKDVNLNNKTGYGETPLYAAIRCASLGIGLTLTQQHDIEPDFNDRKTSMLLAAAWRGHEDIFQVMLELAQDLSGGLGLQDAILVAAGLKVDSAVIGFAGGRDDPAILRRS